MELFKLFGTIALNNSEANNAIDETTSKAEKSESKISNAFRRVGEAVVNGFKKQPIDNVDKSLSGLTKTVSSQEKDLKNLKEKYADLYLTHGKNSKEAKECANEIKKLSGELSSNKDKLSKAEDAANKFDKTITETGEDSEKSGQKIKSAFGKIGSAAVKIGKVAAVGIGAASAAVVAFTKTAIGNYAEYEQLVGGVETLFKDSSDKVLQYANSAYKTAGLSANEYMDTVTSFSASLLQSLDGDTAAAADKANLAITDMSDNANKMGTSMESIQNAYQGFAKQNYTMLDNLKLGYGGTKEEMERLLADAEKISGQKFDLSSYADIVDAIHVVQTNMGITGTTAEEAATTISGSIGMMKSSWQNLVTSIADGNGNIDETMDQFIESVETVGANVIPVVETSINGIATLIEKLAPIIIAKLPGLLNTLLPKFVSTVSSLINSIVKVLPSMIQMIVKQIPKLFSTVFKALIDLLPQLLKVATEAITTIATGLSKSLPALIPELVNVVLTMRETLLDNIDLLVDAAIDLMIGLATGIVNAIPIIVEKMPIIITKLITALAENLPKILQAGIDIVVMLGKGLIDAIPDLVKNIPEITSAILDGIETGVANIAEIGKNLVTGLWNGIKDAKDWVLEKIEGFGEDILDGIKGFFGIHSPSYVMRDQVGKNLALGVAEGIRQNTKYAKMSAAEMSQAILDEAKKKLEKYKVYNDMSLSEEVAYWKKIRKECKKGTDARLEADKNYLEAKKSLDSQLLDAENEYTEKEKSIYNELKENIKSLDDSYKNSVDERKKSILSSFSLFEKFSSGDAVQKTDLIEGLQSQVGALTEWKKQINTLQSRMGDSELFKAIQEMGVSSLEQVKALNQMSEDELNSYANLFDQREKLAEDEATNECEQIRLDTMEQIEQLKEDATKELAENVETFRTTCQELGVDISGMSLMTTEYVTGMSLDTMNTVTSSYKSIEKQAKTSMNKVSEATKNGVNKLNKAMKSIKSDPVVSSYKSIEKQAKKSMNNAVETTKKCVKKLKKAMDFEWSLPKLKLPHFSISGNFKLNPPSVPTFGVDWYKKAMDDPLLMTQPTAFGVNGKGQIMAGGEAGDEVVSGKDTLMNMISEAVAKQNQGLIDVLYRILDAILSMDDNMGGNLREAFAGTELKLNEREFARLVKAVN